MMILFCIFYRYIKIRHVTVIWLFLTFIVFHTFLQALFGHCKTGITEMVTFGNFGMYLSLRRSRAGTWGWGEGRRGGPLDLGGVIRPVPQLHPTHPAPTGLCRERQPWSFGQQSALTWGQPLSSFRRQGKGSPGEEN